MLAAEYESGSPVLLEKIKVTCFHVCVFISSFCFFLPAFVFLFILSKQELLVVILNEGS